MITSLAVEVAAEAGVESLELLAASRAERSARASYALSVDQERQALRVADERGAIVDCRSCMHCEFAGEIVQTLLCPRHQAQLNALRIATARRITAQRALSEAQYALERLRKGMR